MYLFVHKFINFVGKKKLFTKSFKKKKKPTFETKNTDLHLSPLEKNNSPNFSKKNPYSKPKIPISILQNFRKKSTPLQPPPLPRFLRKSGGRRDFFREKTRRHSRSAA